MYTLCYAPGAASLLVYRLLLELRHLAPSRVFDLQPVRSPYGFCNPSPP